MRRVFVATLAVVALSGPAWADQGRAGFTVGATVPLRIALDVVEQPASVTLTAQDVARGYKDVPVRYRVRHNDRKGYALELTPLGPIARTIEIRGLDGDVVLTDAVISIPRPGAAFEQELSLELHLVLDRSQSPGTIALPLRIAATPI